MTTTTTTTTTAIITPEFGAICEAATSGADTSVTCSSDLQQTQMKKYVLNGRAYGKIQLKIVEILC